MDSKLYTDVYYNAVVNTEKDGSIKDTDFPITYMDLRFENKQSQMVEAVVLQTAVYGYDDWVKLLSKIHVLTIEDITKPKLKLHDGIKYW